MTLNSKQLAQAEKRRARLIKICEAFPEVETAAAGEDHLAFKIRKKIFAYYLFDHHGDGMIAFACKSNSSEQRRQIRIDPENFFSPAYVGPRGWLGIRLDTDELDWEIVEQFARAAYQASAPRKLAALLE
jgi:hypothetical protein